MSINLYHVSKNFMIGKEWLPLISVSPIEFAEKIFLHKIRIKNIKSLLRECQTTLFFELFISF